ncbi:MAG TPA: sulfatase-like hydrolase/transferase, partial [Bacteroidia bacterium]|nr:sulfatase-like hydrolase/transferase [Bacteroidia bacterium]
QYADWALGNFIDQAKKYPWFNNTLFIFLGDHGVNFGHTYAMPLSFHHIPCVFYMPSKLKPDTVSNMGGQIDVLPTLLSLLQVPFKNTSMGIDLLHETRPYMYFTADSKIGAIDNDFYYFDLLEEQKELLYQYKDLNTKNYRDIYKSKADSMKAYSSHMIRMANHVVKNKLY